MDIDEYRGLAPEDRRNLIKELLAQTVPRGEVKGTAYAAGLGDYSLYKMRDPECPTHNALREELPLILAHRQDFRLLHWLAGLFNCAVFVIPKPSETHTDINRASTKALKTFSAYMEEVSELVDRLDDGENMFDREWDQELKDIELACRLAQGKLEGLLHTVRLARGAEKLVKRGTAETGRQWAAVGGK